MTPNRTQDLCSHFKFAHTDPQSDRRNLLNSRFQRFKRGRVAGSMSVACKASGWSGAGFRQRFKGSDLKSNPLHGTMAGQARGAPRSCRRNLLNSRFQHFKCGNTESSAPVASKGVGCPVRDSASGSKGRVSKVTLCTAPPARSSTASAAGNGLTPRTGRQIHPGLSAGILMAWRVICHPKPPPK